ncbi:hypothetical protein FBUS_09701, partial [Fasciolopsis buskii]
GTNSSDHDKICFPKPSFLSSEYWAVHCQATLSDLKANRKGNRDRRRTTLTGSINSAHPCSELIPVIENRDLLRCNHCYRTFRTDVAIRHVETCSRKTLLNHGEAPNALGRAVATGISTNQLRSRQVSMNFFRSKLCLVHI